MTISVLGDYSAMYELYDVERCGIPNCKIPNCNIPNMKYNTATDRIFEFCNINPNAFIITPDDVQYVADFSIQPDGNDPNSIKFINNSYSEKYQEMQYLWNFGDGTTTSERNPIHKFPNSQDDFNVTLSVTVNGMIISKKEISGKKGGCSANFTNEKLPTGEYKFTSTSTVSSGDAIKKYYWNFGDGTPTVDGARSQNHIYSQSGQYEVTLTIETFGWCADKRSHTLPISVSSCCLANPKERSDENSYTVGNKTYIVKSVLRATNFWPWHRICLRIVHYQKTGNTSRKEVKTPDSGIGVGYDGFIVNTYCEEPLTVNWSKSVNKKKSRICLDRGVGYPFRVTKNAIHSTYYVKSQSSSWQSGGVSIHNETCN